MPVTTFLNSTRSKVGVKLKKDMLTFFPNFLSDI